tara:strand:+ start:847 stop:1077 length:231 start_codon:yes stop_codon:yes gene_type:complete
MDPFFHKCLDILKKEEVKDEIKTFMKPFIDMMLNELYPYIYLSILFVLVSFFLILGIFILLLRNKSFFSKSGHIFS